MSVLEFLDSPVFSIILTSVLDIITMIVIYRRTGKVSKSTNAVSDDLTNLINYHLKAAHDLQNLTNSTKSNEEKKE